MSSVVSSGTPKKKTVVAANKLDTVVLSKTLQILGFDASLYRLLAPEMQTHPDIVHETVSSDPKMVAHVPTAFLRVDAELDALIHLCHQKRSLHRLVEVPRFKVCFFHPESTRWKWPVVEQSTPQLVSLFRPVEFLNLLRTPNRDENDSTNISPLILHQTPEAVIDIVPVTIFYNISVMSELARSSPLRATPLVFARFEKAPMMPLHDSPRLQMKAPWTRLKYHLWTRALGTFANWSEFMRTEENVAAIPQDDSLLQHLAVKCFGEFLTLVRAPESIVIDVARQALQNSSTDRTLTFLLDAFHTHILPDESLMRAALTNKASSKQCLELLLTYSVETRQSIEANAALLVNAMMADGSSLEVLCRHSVNTTPAMILEAVKACGDAIQYASDAVLQDHPEIVAVALKQSPTAVKYLRKMKIWQGEVSPPGPPF